MANLKSYLAQADHIGVGLVLRRKDGRLIFAVSKPGYWETHHGKLHISFEAVGGGREAGETLIDCARREAKEEASCEIQLHSAARTYLRTAEGKLSVVSLDDKPTPLALYEKVFPHPPDQPELRRPSRLLIVIYLAECLSDPRPSREIPALLVMTSQQYKLAVEGIPLAELLAAGTELIESQHIPRDAIIFPSFGTADLLAQVLQAEGKEEVLSLMNEIEAFYDKGAQYEWERLECHRTEFAVTLRAIKDYLPPAPAKILDVGGGPGRYSIALAQRGYDVTLFDLSKNCLELAKQKAQEAQAKIAGFEHGDARNLSRFADESFDGVLLMGPLYHLLSEEDRRKALREARRVLRANGLLFAAFITSYAVIRWAAKEEPQWIIQNPESLKALLSSGALPKRPDDPGFTSAYFAHPAEIKPLLESEGFETLDLIACEGVISMIEEKINELKGEAFEAWVELNYRLSRDPSIHGAAEHILYVGRKRLK